MEAAARARVATGYTYARREPEKTALYQVLQRHLLTFEQEWTDKSDGRTLPSFVTWDVDEPEGCGLCSDLAGIGLVPLSPLGRPSRSRDLTLRGTVWSQRSLRSGHYTGSHGRAAVGSGE